MSLNSPCRDIFWILSSFFQFLWYLFSTAALILGRYSVFEIYFNNRKSGCFFHTTEPKCSWVMDIFPLIASLCFILSLFTNQMMQKASPITAKRFSILSGVGHILVTIFLILQPNLYPTRVSPRVYIFALIWGVMSIFNFLAALSITTQLAKKTQMAIKPAFERKPISNYFFKVSTILHITWYFIIAFAIFLPRYQFFYILFGSNGNICIFDHMNQPRCSWAMDALHFMAILLVIIAALAAFTLQFGSLYLANFSSTLFAVLNFSIGFLFLANVQLFPTRWFSNVYVYTGVFWIVCLSQSMASSSISEQIIRNLITKGRDPLKPSSSSKTSQKTKKD